MASAMLFAQEEHHDNQRGKSLATQYFEGDTPEVLKQQQAWLPGFPGLQEYLAPWWLSRQPEAHTPMVQIWAARSGELEDHRSAWPRANDVRGKNEMTPKGISSFMDPQKIQTCLSLSSLERPPLEGPPPGFPLKVKERNQAWSCPCPWDPWGLAEDCGTKKGEDRCREQTPNQAQSFGRSCPFPVASEPKQAKAKAAGMSGRASGALRSQPLPTGRVVRADGDHFFPDVTGESTSETSLKLSSEKTEEIKSKVLSDDLKGKAQASPRTESTNTPREIPKPKAWKNKRAKKRGHDSGPKNSVVEYVFQPDHDLLEEFELVPKGIDRGGKKTKGIAEQCNGKARFRGMGSRYFEHKDREAPIPLRLCISCPPENFKEGQEEAKKLLAELQKDFVTKCREHKKWPRPGCKTLYTEYIRAPGAAAWKRTDGPPLAFQR